mgnify:CR=1 FL=1
MRSALSFCAAVVMLTIAAHATANDGPPVDRGPIHRIPVTTMDDRGPIWHLPPQPPMPRRVVADPGPKPWHVTQIEADKCWDKGASGYGVLVAVLDTGADLSHPLLKGRVADSLDYTNSPIGPNDRNQHGTHTATTVAQVAPACKIARWSRLWATAFDACLSACLSWAVHWPDWAVSCGVCTNKMWCRKWAHRSMC